MKFFKHMFIGLFLFIIGGYFLIALIGKSIYDGAVDHKEQYEDRVGDVYIMDGDSLTIVDYSVINETFTLSNGKTVNYHLIVNDK